MRMHIMRGGWPQIFGQAVPQPCMVWPPQFFPATHTGAGGGDGGGGVVAPDVLHLKQQQLPWRIAHWPAGHLILFGGHIMKHL